MKQSLFLTTSGDMPPARLPQRYGGGTSDFALRETATGLKDTDREVERTLLDTFDWRLLKNGYLLEREHGKLRLLTSRDAPELEERVKLRAGTPDPPWSAGELPAGTLRERLAPVIDIRALLAVCTVREKQRRFRILDDMEKTIGFLELKKTAGETTPGIGRIDVFRGYEEECRRFITASDGSLRETSFLEFAKAQLSRGEREPGAYSGKVDLPLSPDMPAPAAMKRIVAYFIGVMQENEKGVLRRIDTEYLHDFRVALRRLRSIVGEAKGSLPKPLRRDLKGDLREIAAHTGSARDLDVLLLREETYRELLPEELSDGLSRFFDWVREKDRAAYRDLVDYLSGQRYREICNRWLAYAETAGGTVSDGNIGEELGEWLQRRLGAMQEALDVLAEDSTDAALHALRVDGKKLRYLLETMGSLLPNKVTSRVVKKLKAFQDALGDFNDLTVQEEHLQDDLVAMRKSGYTDLDVAASVGGLLTRLRNRRPHLRATVLCEARRFRKTIRSRDVRTLRSGKVAKGGTT